MVPLHAGLAHALLDIGREVGRRAMPGLPTPSLVLWADLLRVVPDDGLPVADLASAARISRRAAKAWLGMEKLGWLELRGPTPRTGTVHLTPLARSARRSWGELIASAEEVWCARTGAASATLREALEAFVARLPIELPHYPVPYGPADPSAIGGGSVPAKPGPPRIPPHGADWEPVPRVGADSARGLHLHALLSQALMAFTIDYEEAAGFPMAVAALLAAAMPNGAEPLSHLPPGLGVNGTGKSLLERHGVVQVTGSGQHRTAALTGRGRLIRDAHPAKVAAVDPLWRQRYGEDAVDALADALRSVDERLEVGLPDHVLVRFAPGLGFRDISISGA